MEVYDLVINIWSSIVWRSVLKYIYSCVSFKGKIFVFGMKRGIFKIFFLRVYDVDKNEWGLCLSVLDGIQVFIIVFLRMSCKVLKLL